MDSIAQMDIALSSLTREEMFHMPAIFKSMDEGENLTESQQTLLSRILPKQKRPCGDCTLCCSAPSIGKEVIGKSEDFQEKAACVSCDHVTKGGCSIYSNRPNVCKNYMCLWSIGELDEDSYPPDVGVCWTIQPSDNGLIVVGHTHDMNKVIANPVNVNAVANFLKDKTIIAVTVRDDKEAISFDAKGVCHHVYIDPKDKMKHNILAHTEEKSTYSFG